MVCYMMELLLFAVSVAMSAPVLGEAFTATYGKSNPRGSVFCSSALSTSKHRNDRTTTMAAAIVGGGRIGCALYVSVA